MTKWMSGYNSENDPEDQNLEKNQAQDPNGFSDSSSPKKEKEKGSSKKGPEFKHFWHHRLEFFYGALMVIGILISFFYLNLGGALVGLTIGMCFQKELKNSFDKLSDYYNEEGLFKFALIIGATFYLLIAAPVFILTLAIGFGVMTAIKSNNKI